MRPTNCGASRICGAHHGVHHQGHMTELPYCMQSQTSAAASQIASGADNLSSAMWMIYLPQQRYPTASGTAAAKLPRAQHSRWRRCSAMRTEYGVRRDRSQGSALAVHLPGEIAFSHTMVVAHASYCYDVDAECGPLAARRLTLRTCVCRQLPMQ